MTIGHAQQSSEQKRKEKKGTNHHSDLVWGRWSAIGMTNGFKANWPGVILDLA